MTEAEWVTPAFIAAAIDSSRHDETSKTYRRVHEMTDAPNRALTIPNGHPRSADSARWPAAGGRTPGSIPAIDHVKVAERHGIWTVTEDGTFLGDYHEPEIARAAAAHARRSGEGRGEVGHGPDPWQRSRDGSAR